MQGEPGIRRIPPKCTLTKFDMGNGAKGIPPYPRSLHIPACSFVQCYVCWHTCQGLESSPPASLGPLKAFISQDLPGFDGARWSSSRTSGGTRGTARRPRGVFPKGRSVHPKIGGLILKWVKRAQNGSFQLLVSSWCILGQEPRRSTSSW